METHSVDLLIVGDGIIGHWVANDAAAAGASIVHIGPTLCGDRIPSPSRQSGGLIRTGLSPQWTTGYRRYRALASNSGRSFYHTGILHLQADRSDHHTAAYSHAAVRAGTAGLAPGPWRWQSEAGWVDATRVLGDLRAAAHARGVTAVADRVVSIHQDVTGAWTAVTEQGRMFVAARIAVCAGASTVRLAGEHVAGLPRPVFRRISYALFRQRSFERPLQECVVISGDDGGWLRPTSIPGTVLCGAYRTDYVATPFAMRSCDSREARRVTARLVRWWPRLDGCDLAGGRMSYDVMLPPNKRVAISACRTMVTACGFDGGGFKVAPAISASMVRQLLSDDRAMEAFA